MSNTRQALTAAVGGTIGFFVGGPAGALYGLQIGLLVGTALFPTQLPGVEGPRLQDFDSIEADPGAPVWMCWGAIAVPGFRMYAGQVEEVSETETIGGKGAPTQDITTFSYFQTLALGLCEGEIQGVRRIWENGKLVYDIRDRQEDETEEAYTARLLASDEYASTFTLYLGTEDQLPDPTLEAELGVDNVPAFRGLAYMVYPERHLKPEQAHRHPQFKVEILRGSERRRSIPPTYADESIFDGFQQPDLYAGWDQGYYVSFDQVGDPQGMRVFRLSDNTEIGQYPQSSYYAGLSGSLFLRQGTMIGLDGLVYFSLLTGGSNFILVCIDPLTGARLRDGPGSTSGIFRDAWESCDSFWTPGGHLILIGASSINPQFTLYDSQSLESIAEFSGARARTKVIGGSPGRAYAINYPTTNSGVGPTAIVYDVTALGTSPFTGDWITSIADGDEIAPSDIVPTWTRILEVDGLFFDEEDGTLIFTVRGGGESSTPTEHAIAKWDPVSKTLVWVTPVASQLIIWPTGNHTSRVRSGRLSFAIVGPSSVELDTRTGQVRRTIAWDGAAPGDEIVDEEYWLPNNPSGATVYDARSNRILTFVIDAGPWILELGAPVSEVSLADIVRDICLRSGLLDEQIDVTELEDEIVNGYALTREITGRGGIDPLRSQGLFDIVESDRVLRFPVRGRVPSVTLEQSMLGAYHETEQRPPAVTTRKIQDTELPRQVRVRYMSLGRDYETGEQLSPARLTTASVNDVTVDLPIVLTDDRAAQIAEIVMRDAWAARWPHEFALDYRAHALEPADVVLLPVDGRLYRVRIVAITDEGLVLRRVLAVRDDDGSYTSTAVASSPQRPPQVLHLLGESQLLLLDLPALQEEDGDSAGLYVGVYRTGIGQTWPGAVVYKSVDGGQSYQSVLGVDQQITHGFVVSAPAGDGYTWADGEVVVDIEHGTLADRTDAALFSGANGAAIGGPGRWQIVQFGRQELIEPGRYRLTRLLLGRRGTEHMIDAIEPGDRFVFLSGPGLYRLPLQTGEIDAERHYKAVTIGRPVTGGLALPFAGGAAPLKPFSPVYVRGTREGDDLTITWLRRDRLSHTLRDGVPLPMSEAVESYSVDVMDGDDVVRTIDTSTTSAPYTAAQQSADFGSAQASVTVRIHQVSATVGRGTPAEATV